jgi:hypothetical protein
MSEYLEYSIDNNLLLHYNKKCQQGQPPKDKKDFLKKEVFKMTIFKRVKKAINNAKFDTNGNNGINELITFAYYLGRHTAAVECCNRAHEIFKEQLERAKKSRYHEMAKQIQGNITNIYHGDYSNDFVETFKDDEIIETLK